MRTAIVDIFCLARLSDGTVEFKNNGDRRKHRQPNDNRGFHTYLL